MTILDFGSGGTCLNDEDTIWDMIDELREVDVNRQCVVKWQLWSQGTEPQCARLEWKNFRFAFKYAALWGFRTTASVFDKPSLDYLLKYDIPFVKLANRPYLRELSRYIPRGIPIVASRNPWDASGLPVEDDSTRWLTCVSDYPAEVFSYCDDPRMSRGLSDHTVGLDLWRKYQPAVWEKHYKLPTSRGPDCGPWCVTPDDLKEVLAWGGDA